jgi:tRNA pseudouridine38-40 synthase
VASFKLKNSSIEIEKISIAINSKLKKDIVIKDAEEVDLNFHARYSCKGKKYRYVINNSVYGSSIYRGLEYHMPARLDAKEMNKALKYFEGEHDFTGFKASGTSSRSSIREIYKAELLEDGEKIIIELTGNGFLYNMVRIIAGTVVDVGLREIKSRRYC